MDGEIVVAVGAQRGDAEAVAARREFGDLAAGDALVGRDRPLVVDDVEDHRRPVDAGEHQRGVEVALRRGAVADPGRGDVRVAGDRRGHRPADRLRILRAEVAGDGEEPRLLRRIEAGQLAAFQAVLFVGEHRAHHVDQRPAGGDQQALLAIGREAHVAGLERLAVGAGDRLLAERLDVERGLALALRQQHARVVGARQHHVAQALAQFRRRQRPRPRPDRRAGIVDHADQRIGEIADFGGIDVDRRPPRFAGGGEADMREIRLAARPHRRLRDMQRQSAHHKNFLLRRAFAHGA